jgi:hypothetical protein
LTRLREHVVGVMAVFFALAIGIVLGAGPLQGDSDGTLSEQVSGDQHGGTDLRSQVTALRSSNALSDDFAKTVAPGLIGNSLRGRTVTIVVLPTASRHVVKALKGLIGVAGGSIAGTLSAGPKLVDPGNKQLVDELGKQLADRNTRANVPADANTYERIGALLARGIATRVRGGEPMDGTASNIMAGLDTAGLLASHGQLSRRGDLVLFVTGPGRGGADTRRGASSIVTTLVQQTDAGSTGVVLTGPAAAAQGSGEIKAERADSAAAKGVSTVDSVDRTDGQVVAIMALAGQAAGRTGQYGAVGASDGPMPGSR